MINKYSWLILGLLGQAIFSARFILQWIASEQEKKSVIPVTFWYLSIVGGITLFIYALHTGDLVFILGQSTGVLIYARNLYLILRERKLTLLNNPSNP